MKEPKNTGRRDFMKLAALGLLNVNVDGVTKELTPKEAHEASASFHVLTLAEIQTLEAFGETLLPESVAEGITHFIDYHLSVPAEDCLLLIRYLDVPPPYAPVYKAGLANLNGLAVKTHGQAFAKLNNEQKNELVTAISRGNPEGWQGFPPAPLFYFAVRSDAVDVVYGTVDGFKKLGIPYMPHILPPSRW